MDAITAQIHNEVKHNPQILESWQNGFLTIREATQIIINQWKASTRDAWTQEELEAIAAKIITLDALHYRHGLQECSPATVAEMIEAEPINIIKFLLEYIEELKAIPF